MMEPVAAWFIIATLALVTASDLFDGQYRLLTLSGSTWSSTSPRVRARVSGDSLSLSFVVPAGQEYSVSVESIRLVGGPGSDTYTVAYEDFGSFKRFVNDNTGTAFIPQVQIQDGDLTTLTEYHPLLFKTRFEGKEVTLFREALELAEGTYVYTEGPRFGLILTVTKSGVEMAFECENAGRDRQFRHVFSDLSVGDLTNAQFGGGAGYRNFIDAAATGCSRSDLPRRSHVFFLFLATVDRLYLQLDGLPPTTFPLVKIL
ncbi:hypothetical protein FOZ60_004179 [Perkinsus olseni]|uniref:Uncharacterized protein n=1 Tax=Perkinsus olseni TaxID=32597 RepID=A0A7J6NUN2_PEROL|nr:hypothetical protein FOZ60_004179 [Perkinsus olseni]